MTSTPISRECKSTQVPQVAVSKRERESKKRGKNQDTYKDKVRFQEAG